MVAATDVLAAVALVLSVVMRQVAQQATEVLVCNRQSPVLQHGTQAEAVVAAFGISVDLLATPPVLAAMEVAAMELQTTAHPLLKALRTLAAVVAAAATRATLAL